MKEVRVLGRRVRLAEGGVELEVDEKYVRQAIKALGMEGCNATPTPAAKEAHETHEGRRQLLIKRLLVEGKGLADKDLHAAAEMRGEPLVGEERKLFQSVAPLINFIAPDRADILYASKEVLRGMADPGEADMERLKRLVRYLKGAPRLVSLIPWDADPSWIDVYVDADFAGCRRTRRSTCGGCMRWAGGVVKAWSKSLSTIALSTAEAELGAVTRGAAEGEGLVCLLGDFGLDAQVRLHSDASAAIGITQRLGLGRIRHLSVADLWVQQKVRRKELRMLKLPGETNPADLMTKGVHRPRAEKLLKLMGMQPLAV